MRTLTNVAILALFLAACAFGGYWYASQNKPLPHTAMAAYTSGHYAQAVPLLKQWAQTMTPAKDGANMGKVLTYLADAEAKSKGITAPVGGLTVTTTSPSVATTSPTTQDAIAAIVPPGTLMDPTTGKPRIPHPAPLSDQLLAMTIKELGNFDFDPTTDADIPADVKALDGTRVRLRGFMIPLTQAENITDFALVPSLVGCCFGQPPGVQHTITCKTAKGMVVAYTVDEVNVEGTLKIEVKRDQGYTYSLFNLEVNSVKTPE